MVGRRRRRRILNYQLSGVPLMSCVVCIRFDVANIWCSPLLPPGSRMQIYHPPVTTYSALALTGRFPCDDLSHVRISAENM